MQVLPPLLLKDQMELWENHLEQTAGNISGLDFC